MASPELPTLSNTLDEKADVGAILDMGVHTFN